MNVAVDLTESSICIIQEKVHPKLRTPVNATVFTMVTSGVPALFLGIDTLSNMVSMGTLVTMGMVCAGILFRSHHARGGDSSIWPVAIRLIVICVASICEGRFTKTNCGLMAILVSIGKDDSTKRVLLDSSLLCLQSA